MTPLVEGVLGLAEKIIAKERRHSLALDTISSAILQEIIKVASAEQRGELLAALASLLRGAAPCVLEMGGALVSRMEEDAILSRTKVVEK